MFELTLATMKDQGSDGLVMNGSRNEGVLWGTAKPSAMPPGRGILVTRNGEELIQTGWMPLT